MWGWGYLCGCFRLSANSPSDANDASVIPIGSGSGTTRALRNIPSELSSISKFYSDGLWDYWCSG